MDPATKALRDLSKYILLSSKLNGSFAEWEKDAKHWRADIDEIIKLIANEYDWRT